jgi:hypothetical protein
MDMAFDLDTYKRIVAPVALDDLDLDAFRTQPLDPDSLRCLRYMHDVEHHTSCYLRNLLNTRAHHDPDVTTFLTLWSYEELWHGEAIAAVLAMHEEPAGTDRVRTMRERLGWKLSASPLVWMGFSAVTPHFLAVHMTFGVINEWTTQGGYARLRAIGRHPVLDDLLGRIMKQEGRHIDYYLTRATELLGASSKAQRATRAMLKRMWSPVGSRVMPVEETRHLITTLFADDEGRAISARIDRRIDRLPGLDGLGLMDRALEQWAA